jgi:hypothetical protein
MLHILSCVDVKGFFALTETINSAVCNKRLNFEYINRSVSQSFEQDVFRSWLAKSKSQNQSHVTTDGQSVGMSWCRVHSGTCDQILLSV